MRKGSAAFTLLSVFLALLFSAACKGGGEKTSGPSPEEVTKQAL